MFILFTIHVGLGAVFVYMMHQVKYCLEVAVNVLLEILLRVIYVYTVESLSLSGHL